MGRNYGTLLIPLWFNIKVLVEKLFFRQWCRKGFYYLGDFGGYQKIYFDKLVVVYTIMNITFLGNFRI